jgi:catechol 2,3-dioxygenase
LHRPVATSGRSVTAAARLPAQTRIGTVRLTVRDLERARRFYEQALGLTAEERTHATVSLAAPGGEPVVELHGDPAARPLHRRATGLYHLAILLPTRRDLAVALARLRAAGWPLDGASDHLVSEALYLSDPDGNGIELYRDRGREQWRYSNGQLAMATLPLNLESLLAELPGDGDLPAHAPRATRIGHVHLRVADLSEAETFYADVIGFEVTVRGYPGALFVSAGGYHHHLGLNTWHSAGAPPPPPGSVGLRSFDVVLPGADALAAARKRLRAAGVDGAESDGDLLVRDPSGNALILRAD